MVGKVLAFVLCIWMAENYAEAGTGTTCNYWDMCERDITAPPNCGQWPWCRNFTVTIPCRKTEECTELWGEWSFCTRRCGGGRQFRTGVCRGDNCQRIISGSQPCNTAPCGGGLIQGRWSDWGPWSSTSCSETCCGGTYTMSRSRTCNSEDRDCVGQSSDTRNNMPCGMTSNCPLSCSGEEMSTIFGDPCGVCSTRFFACAGDDMPVELECPASTYWSEENKTCQSMSMCDA